MRTADAVVKKAAVRVLRSHPIDPGKYLLLFAGDVAEVEEGMDAGEEVSAEMLLDRLLLPQVHDEVVPAIIGHHALPPLGSLGIVEAHSVAGAVVGLDAALKAAAVRTVEMRLAAGMGGKGYFVVTGELSDVDAAVEAAVEVAGPDTMVEVIASPHPDFLKGTL
jgi:microcompartment protein CcmL/EutN